MTENGTPAEIPSDNATDTPNTQAGSSSTPPYGLPRTNRTSNRMPAVQSSTNRDFEGATPKLGAVLALRSETYTKR